MSGTSADGIDAAIADFSQNTPTLHSTHFEAFSSETHQAICQLFTPGDNEIDQMGALDTQLGQLYLRAVENLLQKNNLQASDIKAIGLHGQTIRHRPNFPSPFTLQIGNPYFLSQELGVTVVSDFRRADMTLGGQGAPLAPLFHQALFASKDANRVIANIGGISNISYLTQTEKVIGFDTGPGNGFMDDWIKQHRQQPFDDGGNWARTGKVQTTLLQQWLQDPFFLQTPPKSTGKEYFTFEKLGLSNLPQHTPEDIQRTLCELTATSLANAIQAFCKEAEEIWVCGGGAHNQLLMERIASISGLATQSTTDLGIDPNWVEALGFASLAKACIEGTHCDTPSITGARSPSILGAIHPAGGSY